MFFRHFRRTKFLLIIISLTIVSYQIFSLLINRKERKFVEKRIEQIKLTNNSNNHFKELTIQLKPFYVPFPNFVDKDAENWFYNSSYYKINSVKCQNGICDDRKIVFNNSK
ncbi:hypothetical protein DMUE_6370, partial [Dictyocoela muelleri]